MNFPRKLLFLFVFVIPVSLLAQFVSEVKHDKIFKIAVERNVVTFFMFSEAPLGVRHTRLGTPVEYLRLRYDDDHALINHHGHGVDGIYAPHEHVTFVAFSLVPPDLLNVLLIEASFLDEERVRIMQEYANYFTHIPRHLLSERPLRPGQRDTLTVATPTPVQTQPNIASLPPTPITIPQVRAVELPPTNWQQLSPTAASVTLLLLFMSTSYSATSHF